ncbi:DUF2391 family protein [Salinibaculum rarum]|uniref:DUF2391 family protein n=1 Tax=Salinibaculum rarum TaxID=3058903 RepID=UPI00265DA015|nr:DUF2391 family protein [Salinibaculum sp. KK48]
MSSDLADDDAVAPDDQPEMADLYEQLEDLEEMVDSQEVREHVRETMRMAVDIGSTAAFGRIIRGYDRADVAEAVLGALLFGIPMFVEGGTNEVGAFIAGNPLYFAGTHVLALSIVISIIYVADIQDVRVHRPLFGLVPRRLVGVMTVSFVMAVVMMTGWGRVSWSDPWLAVCTVSVAFVPMAIGAALGDILPGS